MKKEPTTTRVSTPRERGVLRLRAAGLSIKAIARRLRINASTVDTHLARISKKIGSRDPNFLARFEADQGIIGKGRYT